MRNVKHMPRTNFEIITPDIAKKYLEKNKSNRPINERHLLELVSEMKKDNFHLTGESVKFSVDGDVLDGQHRLMAIIMSGKKQEMLVIRNLENVAFKYMDTNRPRTAGDVLGIEGYKNPARVAATAKFIMNFTGRGGVHQAAQAYSRGLTKLTNAMVSEFVHNHKKHILDSLEYGYSSENKIVAPAALSGLHYVFNKLDDHMADDFCHKLAVGIQLAKDSPIYILRQRLIADLRSTKKLKAITKIALICKAWNYYRGNKKVLNITWDSVKEPFPKPI